MLSKSNQNIFADKAIPEVSIHTVDIIPLSNHTYTHTDKFYQNIKIIVNVNLKIL